MRDVAFVPPDPALNLLQTQLDPTVTIYSKISETLTLVLDQLVRHMAGSIPAAARSRDLIAYYLSHNHDYSDPQQYVRDVDSFLVGVARTGDNQRLQDLWEKLNRSEGHAMLSSAQAEMVRQIVARLKTDELVRELVRVLQILDDALEALAGSSRGFLQQNSLDHHRIVRGAVPKVLRLLAAEFDQDSGKPSRAPRLPVFARHAAATALFLIAADKELADEETFELLRRLVPSRVDGRGQRRRDRYQQILRVLARDEQYHRLFYQVVRTVFPGITRRISSLNESFSLRSLMLRDASGDVNASAYVKLTTHLVHDVVNAGLGVSISATYNAASQAIRAGVEEVVRDRGWRA
jgi:flagellar biosynthesis protein FlhG